MANFTYDQYKIMAGRFNRMPFIDKIKTIKDNSEILTLASDGNWWGVKVKDKDIQDLLEEEGYEFEIENEWQYKEMSDLICLLGMENTDI